MGGKKGFPLFLPSQVLPSAWLRPPKNIVRAVEWRKVLLEGEGFLLVALGAWGWGQAERLEAVDGPLSAEESFPGCEEQ